MTLVPNQICMKLTAASIIAGSKMMYPCDTDCGQYNLCHGIKEKDKIDSPNNSKGE